jgi:hypothetical protein
MEEWRNFTTLQSGDEGFEEAENLMVPVFRNGEILIEYSFPEIRENAKINYREAVTA